MEMQRLAVTLTGDGGDKKYVVVNRTIEDAAFRRRLSSLKRAGKIQGFYIQPLGNFSCDNDEFHLRLSKMDGNEEGTVKKVPDAERMCSAMESLSEAVWLIEERLRPPTVKPTVGG